MLLRFTALALLISVAALPQASAQQKFNYLSRIIDIPELIPPPPLPDSEAQKRDILEVIEVQERRTEAQLKKATAEKVLTFYYFADVLGPKYNKQDLPVTYAFFEKMQANSRQVLVAAKNAIQRPRPFLVSKDVFALAGTPRLPTGYPSGGTVYATTTAILLGKMIPEKRRDLFERNAEIGMHRVLIGEHFPRDVRAGEATAAVIIQELMGNPVFMKDFEAARAELRSVLGYPAEPDVVGALKPK